MNIDDGDPEYFTGNWIEFICLTSELEALAADAPAERRSTSSGETGKRPSSQKRGIRSIIERAANYVEKMDAAVSGEEGHKQTFAVACVLILGFDLSIDQARPIFAEYNQRCQPPWSDAELEHKLEDAAKADGDRGYLLNSAVPFSDREIIPLDYSQVTFEPFPLNPPANQPALIPELIDLPSLDTPIVDEADPLASLSILPSDQSTENALAIPKEPMAPSEWNGSIRERKTGEQIPRIPVDWPA